MWLQKQITVREVNRCLSDVINDLQAKYGKVSHPDFEKELEALTGIQWKQVKNYRNHPQPDTPVKDNAKVKKFVLAQRRKTLLGKLLDRRVLMRLGGVLFLCLAFFGATKVRDWFSVRPERSLVVPAVVNNVDSSLDLVTQEIPDGRIKLRVDEYNLTFNIGRLNSSVSDFKEMVCQSYGPGGELCMFSNDGPAGKFFQFQIILRGQFVTSFVLITSNQRWLGEWRKQIKAAIAVPLIITRNATEVWSDDRESVEIGRDVVRVKLKNQ